MKSVVREQRPAENYLDFVRKENAKHPRKLPSVNSVPNLKPLTEPKRVEYKTPLRSSEKGMGGRGLRSSVPSNNGGIDWSENKAKAGISGPRTQKKRADVINDDELANFDEVPVSQRREKLSVLNQKVKQFE